MSYNLLRVLKISFIKLKKVIPGQAKPRILLLNLDVSAHVEFPQSPKNNPHDFLQDLYLTTGTVCIIKQRNSNSKQP